MSENPLSLEAKELIEEIRAIQKDVDYRKSEAATMLIMILVITKQLESYLETCTTKILQ